MSRSERSTMRPFQRLVPWPEALRSALAQVGPQTGSRRLPVVDAVGRVLAADVLARHTVPNSDRAAMDGYAVRAIDCAPQAQLGVQGRVAAGDRAQSRLQAGRCIEIATGARVPVGADAVVPVENTLRSGDSVQVRGRVQVGDHIVECGSDLREGRPVARAGAVLHPALLAAVVAAGVAEVEIVPPPRVLVAPTGDEVVAPGQPLRPGQVYDSNAQAVIGLLGTLGAEPHHAGVVRDDQEAIDALLAEDADLIVTIGGTSVGRRDLVSEVVRKRGRIQFHGVAVKPGKPLLFGSIDSRSFVGLPGFPATCLLLAYAFLDPLVRRLLGLEQARARTTAQLAVAIASPPDKAQLLPVALRDGSAYPTFRGSSAVSSLAEAQGWVEIPAQTRYQAGDRVSVVLF